MVNAFQSNIWLIAEYLVELVRGKKRLGYKSNRLVEAGFLNGPFPKIPQINMPL